MATSTYDLLDSVTLTSSANSITFSGIDQSFQDLSLVFDFPAIAVNQFQINVWLKFNNSATGYYYATLRGNGSTAAANTGNNSQQIQSNQATYTENDLYMGKFDIFDYSQVNRFKSFMYKSGAYPAANMSSGAGSWHSTAAITQIQVFTPAYNYPVGTTAKLFGIAG